MEYIIIIQLDKFNISQNVIGMKDKDITTEIENGGNIITVTIIPSYIYDHMMKKYVYIL